MIGILLLAILALALAASLVVTARRLRFDPEALAGRIDAQLPQTQCAQCGYPGCQPYARAIARGEQLFNTRPFTIDNVGGLNGGAGDPIAGPFTGTCTVCHDTPNAGNHSISMALNIGLTDESRRTADLPLYRLQNNATNQQITTTDPGRAMVTGKWSDIGKFKGPVLRALASRAPYFHNGSAATLEEAIDFYDTRFHIGLSLQEKADLIAFLNAL